MISFPDFFEKAPLAILIVVEGEIVKYNPAFTKTFGDLPAGDILNKPIADLVNIYHNHKETNRKTGKFFCTINRPSGQRKVEVSLINNTDDPNTHPREDYWIISPVPDAFQPINHTPASSKKPQEVYEESKENYKEGIQMAKLAFWKLDIQQNIVVLSKEFGELIGEHWQRHKEMRQRDYIEEYIHPSDKNVILAMSEVAENNRFTKTRHTVEFRLLKKGGEIIHVITILKVKCDDNQIPITCEGVIQDITLLRKAEAEIQEYQQNLEKLIVQRTEELKISEERLHDALKLGKLTTWEFCFDTKKYYVGGEIGEIIGPAPDIYLNSEIEVDDFEKLIYPDDLPVYFESFQRALKAKDERYLDYIAYRIIRPDGGIKQLYLSIKVEKGDNDRLSKLYGTIQDITSFRKIEEEKERLNATIEITPDIVAIVDPKGTLIYLNQSGRFFYGFLESIEHINFLDLQKEETKDLLKNIGFLVASSEGIWTGESELRGKNDQTIPVSMVIVAHFGQEGLINSYSIVIRNISAQKKTEQDLLYKNAELDTFVYRASHDLRGPISSLLGLYQIVQYEIKEEKALVFFEMFNKQILRLNEIILALINLTKIKESVAGRVSINFTEIVNDAIDSLRHLTGFSNIQFNVKINVKRDYKSDKGMITTIIQNLIENAIKYSKTNIAANIKISVESYRNAMLAIVVEDNGIGIDKKVQGNIFDMFFRGHEISKGSGLGLYILKNAVEKLKGKIVLQSEVSKGTTFTVELPYLE